MGLSNLPPDVTDSMIDAYVNGEPGYCISCDSPTEYTCSFCEKPCCENCTYEDKYCSPECADEANCYPNGDPE